jgi:hypothetical protein
MRETVHFSLASHDEVMYRDEADLIHGFNCLVEACLETESRLLADGFMTTHHHGLVQTDNIKALTKIQRYAYTRFFNARHCRRGSIGEVRPFTLSIEGLYHTIVALNYVNRQGLHHGLSDSAFGYPFCSANACFMSKLGKISPERLMPDELRYLYLPDRSSVPKSIRMDASGMLLQEDAIDTAYVEQIYLTPRNYLYQMNKLTDENWVKQQESDQTKSPIITLDLIETGVGDINVEQLLRNEHGTLNTNQLTDLALCKIIDTEYLPGISHGSVRSIYELSTAQRRSLCETLWKDIPRIYKKSTTVAQLRRCACLNY